MKYILQIKNNTENKWFDLESSEDSTVIEGAFIEKANDVPISKLRIVKEAALQVNFNIKIVD